MKKINLNVLSEIIKKCDDRLVDKYLSRHNAILKVNEKEDFLLFVNTIKASTDAYEFFEDYVVKYVCPEDHHTFDLIRFSKNQAVNIELRHTTDIKNIEADLKKNYQCLSQSKNEVACFVYVADYDEIYSYNGSSFKLSSCEKLITSICGMDKDDNHDIRPNFNTSKSLVSPFNHTEDFKEDRYFLTPQQDEVKSNIMKTIHDDQGALMSITGEGGTGKSLLIHDIAKALIKQGKSICMVHCGILSEGHYKLKSINDWPIYKVEEFFESLIMDEIDYDVVMFDDVQALDQYHFESIQDMILVQDKKIILSADKNQQSWHYESYNAFKALLKYDWSKCYEMSNKIKTNLEIVSFMSCVFNKKKQPKKLNYHNVDLSFFSSKKEIIKHISSLKASGWQEFYFSSSLRHKKPFQALNTFQEMTLEMDSRQDFDKVAVVMDDKFIYNEEGKLMVACNSNYQAPMLLHQIMTRTIKKLHVIILDNAPLLEHLLDIIDQDTFEKKGLMF